MGLPAGTTMARSSDKNTARPQAVKAAPPTQRLDAHLPLTPATFQILLTLVDGDRHGYAIMQEVAERTEGDVRLGPGTLYGSLKRLLEAGLVAEGGEESDPELGDERRRYYCLTRLGLAVARAEARRLEAMVRMARQKKLLGLEPA